MKNEILLFNYNSQIKTRLDKVKKLTNNQLNDYITYEYTTNDFTPDSYKVNDKLHVLQWQGRYLIRNSDVTYKYDENGIRNEKNAINGKTTYITEGNNIVRSINNNIEVTYHYDEYNQIVGFRRLDKEYFYDRDITGNIISILDVN